MRYLVNNFSSWNTRHPDEIEFECLRLTFEIFGLNTLAYTTLKYSDLLRSFDAYRDNP